MTSYAPKQRQVDGRWEYTLTDDTGTRAVGRCAGEGEWGHHDGHATAAEAERCFREYELDSLCIYAVQNFTRQCVVCGTSTHTMALVGIEAGDVYAVCYTHANRISLAPIHHSKRPTTSKPEH